MIEYFIQLMDLDHEEEHELRWKLKPVQDKINTAKSCLAWLCILGAVVWGFSSLIYCGNRYDAQVAEERHQKYENKCQIWANIHSIDVKWNRDMWLCMGKGKDGSVYTVVLESGRIKKLKGRD